ncbi:MAG: hypothetical protein ACE5IR_16695 [bacterium]
MDVTKYLLTIGFIGGVLTEKINILSGALLVIAAIIVFSIAFYTIPKDEEQE